MTADGPRGAQKKIVLNESDAEMDEPPSACNMRFTQETYLGPRNGDYNSARFTDSKISQYAYRQDGS